MMRILRYSPVIVTVLALVGDASAACPQLLSNNEFSTGIVSPWMIEIPGNYASVSSSISTDENQTLELTVTAFSSIPYLSDAGLSQGFSLVEGEQYRLSFWANADHMITAQVKVGDADSPYDSYGLDEEFAIYSGDGSTHEFTFIAPTTDASAGLIIMFGAESANIKFDSIFLEQVSSGDCTTGVGGAGSGGTSATGGTLVTGAAIRVNQVGYVPRAEKTATVKHGSPSALDWQLIDGMNNLLATGVTHSMAADASSGDYVHFADFSAYTTPGTGLRLKVGSSVSPAFRIGGDVYGGLRRDALRFYYHQRASTAITLPYAEGSQWVRASGHPDSSVPCRTGSGCSYSLNVSKGWYDAGDYGKYVVNAGISVWTLMNLYERAAHLGSGTSALADNTLNIPESGNGVSDLLDQIRWEMEFMLGMQVPAGQTLSGMVHHKVHGTMWPAIPIAPADDATGRFLSAPSTAATLNLAAAAAQCARLFASSDVPFATRCRTAAEAAYVAAEAHPAVYAVNTPQTGDEDGGGAYEDSNVTDEFYWASVELFITTGESRYLDALLASSHHKKAVSGVGPFSWNSTAFAGALSLAVVPSTLSSSVLGEVRNAIVSTANGYRLVASTGYGSPIRDYGWGSNSDVLNAAIVLAVAYDLTGDVTSRGSAVGALDYVLGRNPLGQSYVTGYGVLPFENAHHRFFSNAYNSSWPKPPNGFIAGGPNKKLDGLSVQGSLAGCTGSKCWTDNAEAYGLTEVTINWNAPLAWVAAWSSEQETNPKYSYEGVGGAGGTSNNGSAGSGQQGGSIASETESNQAGAAGDEPGGNGGVGQNGGSINTEKQSSKSDGCGCRVVSSKQSSATLAILALLSLLGVRRKHY